MARAAATGTIMMTVMPHSDNKTLVSTAWVAERLGESGLRLFDASWYLPAMSRDAKAEFGRERIPDAQYFDIDEVADGESPLPHMAPSPEKFTALMREMGVCDDDQIVVYDGAGVFSAPRAWWLFKLMGKSEVAVLDGGLPKWKREGRPVTSETAACEPGRFSAAFRQSAVRSMAEVLEASSGGSEQIVDARPAGRFQGNESEPRQGLRAGHIPGSLNLPFAKVLNSDGTMRTVEEIEAVVKEVRIDMDAPVITSCGSGVSAAILNLALERIGHKTHALYDGSWAEWGAGDAPVETGEAQNV